MDPGTCCARHQMLITQNQTHLSESPKLSAAGSRVIRPIEKLNTNSSSALRPVSSRAVDKNTEGPEMPLEQERVVHQDLECTVRGCLTLTASVWFNLAWFSVFPLDEWLNCR